MQDPGSHTLEVDGLRKSFGSNEVLKGINLTIRSGEFIGLMGPNGAGKSTLIKILAGVYQASSGQIRLGGRTLTSLGDTEDVAFIHQDLGLVDALTIAENFALGNPPQRLFGPILNKRAERTSAARALGLVGLDLSVDTLLSDLTPGQKTLVAVARAMDRGARILIVDEATSTLPPRDAQGVILSLAAAAAAGATVVMVTHKLSEILEATSRVLVILDGEMVRDAPTHGLDRAALVEMLMQHESDPHNLDDASHQTRDPVLELRGVHFEDLGPIDLTLNAGEVIGISGLPGSGLHDIALLVNGTLKPHKGEVVESRPRLTRALVPPHRESQGGFGELSIRENMALSALGRWRRLSRVLKPRREELDCARVASELSIKPASIDTTFDILSGGNKQKVIFGRALLLNPDVFVLCEPTRGVDVGTRSEIYRLIRELARGGAAVLVASSDAEDLFSVCDRVALVADGRLQQLRPVSELSTSELELMV
ncbi:sugar ABC transporter ATP-binding protein [Nocardioides immobilis]|uniref:Sugar ABC transporter ATP-binding protein n=1 Tax=Nocardioides immobilis TaxID=2049295 RepID=A0A417XU05_9ACTN|nr:sugar ABC transporter ATP-binding protein [Nocardioides immobilis]RHW23785.1 sugar ABC transporter ATP-binding protein [Nocardioides immobilis]